MNQAMLFSPPVLTSPTQCRVGRTRSYKLVSDLVARWHSTLPSSPACMTVAFLAYAPNQRPVAVAMWNHPTATNERQHDTLELQRQAHSPHVPHNFGSWFLARQRDWIREHMPDIVRLISYQDADVHHGTLYKADNWRKVYEKHGESTWSNRPGRVGLEVQHKIKWERRP